MECLLHGHLVSCIIYTYSHILYNIYLQSPGTSMYIEFIVQGNIEYLVAMCTTRVFCTSVHVGF